MQLTPVLMDLCITGWVDHCLFLGVFWPVCSVPSILFAAQTLVPRHQVCAAGLAVVKLYCLLERMCLHVYLAQN